METQPPFCVGDAMFLARSHGRPNQWWDPAPPTLTLGGGSLVAEWDVGVHTSPLPGSPSIRTTGATPSFNPRGRELRKYNENADKEPVRGANGTAQDSAPSTRLYLERNRH
jgi:hypothetical protein